MSWALGAHLGAVRPVCLEMETDEWRAGNSELGGLGACAPSQVENSPLRWHCATPASARG